MRVWRVTYTDIHGNHHTVMLTAPDADAALASAQLLAENMGAPLDNKRAVSTEPAGGRHGHCEHRHPDSVKTLPCHECAKGEAVVVATQTSMTETEILAVVLAEEAVRSNPVSFRVENVRRVGDDSYRVEFPKGIVVNVREISKGHFYAYSYETTGDNSPVLEPYQVGAFHYAAIRHILGDRSAEWFVGKRGETTATVTEAHSAEESAPVLYETHHRAHKPKKFRWHRDGKDGYMAKGQLGEYCISKQKSNRRHDVLPTVLSLNGKPLKSFDTKTEAQVFARTYDEIVPYARTHQTAHVQPGVHAAEEAPYATIQKNDSVKSPKKNGHIDDMRDCYLLLQSRLEKEDQEVFLVVPLDIQNKLRHEPIEVARGQRSQVLVDPVDVLRAVIVSGASSYYCVHVHPSGNAKPSKADHALTESIEKSNFVAFGGSKGTKPTVEFRGHMVAGKNQYANCGHGQGL